MSVDHYDIDISDSIATLGAQQVVDECYNSNVLCEYVFRDSTGVLSRVGSPYLNLQLARAVGVDYEIDYARAVDFFSNAPESLSIRLLAGNLEKRTSTVVGSTPAEFAGTRGYPDHTANLIATYHVGHWDYQVQQRYIGEVTLNRLWVEGIDVDKNTISSQSWTNLVVGYESRQGQKGTWRVSLNVQNLFDKNPPIIATTTDTRFGAQSTDNIYDEFGRRYEVGFRMQF
jgi:iron complex outermembrane recepter protein